MLIMTLATQLKNRIGQFREVSRQRRELRRISDHLLKDIGLSRVDADREAARPFWDLAPNRDASLLQRGRKRQQNRHGKVRPRPCCAQD